MPTKLITVQRAEKEVKRLMHYINLAENYDADTLNKWVIKEYAFTNSVTELVKRANDRGTPITKEYASSVIKGKATDELHRILKSGYMARITPKKSKWLLTKRDPVNRVFFTYYSKYTSSCRFPFGQNK